MSANRRAGSKKKPASKARASGTKGARSRAARKGASGAKSKRASTRDPKASLFSRLLRLVLLLAGLGLGLLVPWTLWLNHLITTEFEGRKWDLPSRVFARPLSLFAQMPLTASQLERELEAAGYRRADDAGQPGSWSRSGATFDIHRRGFRFDDGFQEALRFRLTLADGRIVSVRDAVGTSLGLMRLDPAEIASIYPLHEEDRTLITIDQAPDLLVQGLQAVEDRNFKHHHGLDPRGIARAAAANLKAGRTVQGGSTLTQQLVKNYYLENDRTLPRKVNEALMSLLLEWHYSKAEILEAYLNEVFLGQQGNQAIHGFGRASEHYFGQPVERLQAHQVALLVGMVKGASLYHPRRNPERARERRDLVLASFEETGLLAPGEAATWQARPLDVVAAGARSSNRYPAFLELVRDQLQRDYREADLRTEGLRIFTTLAPFEQQAAEAAVTHGLKQLAERGLDPELQAALVLADSDAGEIRALVGDRNPRRRGFNRALNARRQVGSVIKPFIYLLALEHPQRYSWLTRLEDEPITLTQADGQRWAPANYDGQSHGSVSLLEALVRSYNQATVRLGMNIGLNELLRKLQSLGVTRALPELPSTLLGAAEMTPLDVTQAYQPLASGGFAIALRAVTAVQTADGASLRRYPLRLDPVPQREAIAVLNYGLTQVVEQGTAKALPGLLGQSVTVAGKTGTTNERRDSWFVGYTRDRLGVVWVGLDDNRPARVTGSNAAMPLWAGLFRQLPLQSVSLDLPEGASWRWVDPLTATLSQADCPGASQMPFVTGSEPSTRSNCLEQQEQDADSFWRRWFDRD